MLKLLPTLRINIILLCVKKGIYKKSILCVSDILSVNISIYLLFDFNVVLAGKDSFDKEQLLK